MEGDPKESWVVKGDGIEGVRGDWSLVEGVTGDWRLNGGTEK